MAHYKVTTNTSSHIMANIEDNVFNVKYSEHIKHFHTQSLANYLFELLNQEIGPINSPSIISRVNEIAESQTDDTINNIRKLTIPEQIKEVLDKMNLKKKEQITSLKAVTINTALLSAIFLYAEDQGYLFSNMRFEGEPKQFNPADVPSFIRITDNGNIEHTGKTPLSDGQLKSIVDQSQFIVARILTKGDIWHCFLQTRHGVLGNERGAMGSIPHIHYFSSAFGYDLEIVKQLILTGSYPKTPIHIPLIG